MSVAPTEDLQKLNKPPVAKFIEANSTEQEGTPEVKVTGVP